MSYLKKRLTEIVQGAVDQKQIPAGHDDALEVRREPIGTGTPAAAWIWSLSSTPPAPCPTRSKVC